MPGTRAIQIESCWCIRMILDGEIAMNSQSGGQHQVEIPAGPFQFGCSIGDKRCEADEGGPGGVTIVVPAFSIDASETSVGEYRECVEDRHCTRPFDYKRVHYCNYEPANCTRAVMDPGKRGELNRETDGCWRDLSWPRNSFPPNPFGLYDMIGGASEWVMDWYDPDSHANVYAKRALAF